MRTTARRYQLEESPVWEDSSQETHLIVLGWVSWSRVLQLTVEGPVAFHFENVMENIYKSRVLAVLDKLCDMAYWLVHEDVAQPLEMWSSGVKAEISDLASSGAFGDEGADVAAEVEDVDQQIGEDRDGEYYGRGISCAVQNLASTILHGSGDMEEWRLEDSFDNDDLEMWFHLTEDKRVTELKLRK